jgi:histidinol-phosphate aminotransferase
MSDRDSLSNSVRGLLRADVWNLTEYGAPEALEAFAARIGIPVDQVAKLDQNENPYGCSPRVNEALARCTRVHVYPDPVAADARAALEPYVGVSRDRLAVGNGSDELIEVLFRLFLRPGDKVLSFTPTFGYYPTAAGFCAADFVGVPRRADWTVDIDAGLAALDDRTKIIIVASPNNPTGTLTPPDDIRRLLDTGRLVILDEAYFEFAGQTALPLADEYDNVVILRTFSKWAGLAGLRVGYGVFPEWLLPQLYKLKPPYGVSVAAMVALEASLADADHLRRTVDLIVAERERLLALLATVGYLRPHPTAANFVLCECERGTPKEIRRALETYGILVRAYSDPILARQIRFSVGKPEHTDRLIAALKEIGASL